MGWVFRLALRAAEEVAARFSDGAWLCELGLVRDPVGVDDGLVAAASHRLGRPEQQRRRFGGVLAQQQLLLVLDNCEHLLEAAAAALAGVLQRSCGAAGDPGDQLGGPGHRRGAADAGAAIEPGAGADLSTITEAEAVRLFAERAAAVKPGFAVTPTMRPPSLQPYGGWMD